MKLSRAAGSESSQLVATNSYRVEFKREPENSVSTGSLIKGTSRGRNSTDATPVVKLRISRGPCVGKTSLK